MFPMTLLPEHVTQIMTDAAHSIPPTGLSGDRIWFVEQPTNKQKYHHNDTET